MKSFNKSQIPLVQNLEENYSKINGDYNTNPNIKINNHLKNGYDSSYNPDQSKYITQNLRLLKTKMSMSSTTSNNSDGFQNSAMKNMQLKSNKSLQNYENISSENKISNDYDTQSVTMVNQSANKGSSYSILKKQQPVKADHLVLKTASLARSDRGDYNDEYITPQKRNNEMSPNPYETTSGKILMRATQKSAIGEDDTKYLSSEEIEKLYDPKNSLKQLLTDLNSKDWEVQINSCNILRSIAIHNCNMLDSSFFKSVFADLINIASSLRSSVCKNGLLAFQDIFKNCSKSIEFDLDSISNILIKKSNDTNVFISSEAERSLLSMCSYCNEFKVLSTIMTHASNRSSQVKSKVAKCLQLKVKQSQKNYSQN